MSRCSNRIELLDDHALVYLRQRDGTEVPAMIDLADVERVTSVSRRWYPRRGRRYAGYYAYTCMMDSGREVSVPMHRFILGITAADGQVDHINGDKADNRRCNLRVVPKGVNQRNIHQARPNSKTGLRGVKFHPKCRTKPWQAAIKIDKVSRSLGYYATKEEASAAVIGALALLRKEGRA